MIRAEEANEAKKKHSKGLAKTDQAYEVVDIEKNLLFTLVDPSIMSHVTTNDHIAWNLSETDSLHVFYKIQATSGSLPSSWPPPAIISFMEKITYKNMFSIDEDESSYDIAKLSIEHKLHRTKTVEDENIEIERVRFKRDIFLVNQLKAHDIKTDRKYKVDDLGSNVIQAFARDLYKSLPKPIEEVGETLIEVNFYFLC
jgi:hypothetical protein